MLEEKLLVYIKCEYGRLWTSNGHDFSVIRMWSCTFAGILLMVRTYCVDTIHAFWQNESKAHHCCSFAVQWLVWNHDFYFTKWKSTDCQITISK